MADSTRGRAVDAADAYLRNAKARRLVDAAFESRLEPFHLAFRVREMYDDLADMAARYRLQGDRAEGIRHQLAHLANRVERGELGAIRP